MSTAVVVLIEVGFFFGGCLAFTVWQLGALNMDETPPDEPRGSDAVDGGSGPP